MSYWVPYLIACGAIAFLLVLLAILWEEVWRGRG